jgi:hypothetical protein
VAATRVNRLLYGARHEPEVAVETLGRQLGAAVDPAEVLPTLVAAIARALRLGYAAVELADGDGFAPAAEVGAATAGETLVIPLVAHCRPSAGSSSPRAGRVSASRTRIGVCSRCSRCRRRTPCSRCASKHSSRARASSS